MSDNDAKAKILVDEANKIMNSSGIFDFLFKNNRQEDGIEKYRKAGNLYKLSKDWTKAGECFRKCASYHEGTTESASFYLDAANCYRKINASETAHCYGKAIEVYKDLGRFSMVAKYYQLIGEIYEEFKNYPEAIKNFEEAADYYNTEGAYSTANKCFLKVATYSALADDYAKAIKYYEDVAKSELKSPLMKYCVKEHLFKALICALCYDIEGADKLKDKYIRDYPPLQDSREYKLFLTLLQCVMGNKINEFSQAVEEYEKVLHLDDWYTQMFLKIKQLIDSELC